MTWFANLKLNIKFNLILSILLISFFLLTAFLAYRDQQELVLDLALEQGRGVAKQIIATSDYMSTVVRSEPEENYALVPQVVATQVAKRISAGSRYKARQISLRFRNPENRPDPYESRQLKAFAHTAAKENYQVTKEDGRDIFRYMKPMYAEKSCLECHGTYESAPKFIQQRYPKTHPSYNYQLGEVIGAVSFTRPMADLYHEVGSNLMYEVVYRLSILALVFVTMGILIRRFMINPIQQASSTIHRVTTTGNLAERISTKAHQDEVGQLISDFNEMMEELGRTTLQRQESETRYRNLIEASDSAIVTFLENGKIIISNQRAENLLGISRHILLGETFFDYLENGDILREGLDSISQGGTSSCEGEAKPYHLRDVSGRIINVEITLLLASRTDNIPMFTAIIREK